MNFRAIKMYDKREMLFIYGYTLLLLWSLIINKYQVLWFVLIIFTR
jgi:hypothetical protein